MSHQPVIEPQLHPSKGTVLVSPQLLNISLMKKKIQGMEKKEIRDVRIIENSPTG